MQKTLLRTNFVVGGSYQNRRGEYTIKSLGADTMEVVYADGEKAILNKIVQDRIIRNTEFNAQIEEQIKLEESMPVEEKKTRGRRIQHLVAWEKKVVEVKKLEEMSVEELLTELSRIKGE